MPPQKLINYIKDSLNKGFKKQDIKKQLINVGWKEGQIEEAFAFISTEKKKGTNEVKNAVKRVDQKKDDFYKDERIKDKSFNLKPVLIALLVLIVLIGGGVSAFFLMGDPEEDPDPEEDVVDEFNPQEEIMNSLRNMGDLNSLSSTTSFSLVADGDEGYFDGSFSFITRVDEQAEEAEFILEGEAMADGLGGSFKGSLLVVNDKLFARLDRFPDLGMFLPLPSDFGEIRGRYILLVEDIADPEVQGDLDEEYFSADIEMFMEEIFEEDVDPEIVEEFLTDIMEMIWEKEIITVIGSEDDQIDGVSVNRHDLDVDPENLPDLMIEIAEKYEDFIKDLDAEEVREEVARNREDFEELKEDLEKVDFSLSIWVDGDYVYKVELVIDEIEDEMDELEQFELIFGVKFGDFNQPLNLEEPEDYMTVEEVEEIFMDMDYDMDYDMEFDDDPMSLDPIEESPEFRDPVTEDCQLDIEVMGATPGEIKLGEGTRAPLTVVNYNDPEEIDYWVEDEEVAQIKEDSFPVLHMGIVGEGETELIVEDLSQGEDCRIEFRIKPN